MSTIGPVDSFLDLESSTPTNVITLAILNAGSKGNAGWQTLFDSGVPAASVTAMTIQASNVSMPNAINVSGTTYPSNHTTHSIKFDHTYFYSTAIYGLAATSVMSVGCWITFGPPDVGNSAVTFDYLFVSGNGGSFAGIQLRNGLPYHVWIETGSPTLHSPYIEITPGGTYWCTMKVDWTNGLATLAMYDTSLVEVGYTSVSMPTGETASTMYIGNNEVGTATATSYFEDLIIDNTDGKFPLGPSGVVLPHTFDVLVQAGGGAGGSFGGGGGGGGLIQSTIIPTVQTYTVTVGAGGTGNNTYDTGVPGGNGSDSVFSIHTAIGGGGGASRNGGGPTGHSGLPGNGGCGGGSSPNDNSGDLGTGGTGSQGYAGGHETSEGWGGGGGGGTAGVGGNGVANQAGNGGPGAYSSITGLGLFYGGGGGGGCYIGAQLAGSGGRGGGGQGTTTAIYSGNGFPGDANTGGGGGGGEFSGVYGGDGGTGVVILSFPTGSVTATGTGTYTTTTKQGRDVWIFTTSGTFIVSAVSGIFANRKSSNMSMMGI